MSNLIDKIFSLQETVNAAMKTHHPELTCYDSGMFVPEGDETVLWRQNTWAPDEESAAWWFSFNTECELIGDYPDGIAEALASHSPEGGSTDS